MNQLAAPSPAILSQRRQLSDRGNLHNDYMLMSEAIGEAGSEVYSEPVSQTFSELRSKATNLITPGGSLATRTRC